MASSKTDVCNMALGRLGETQLTDVDSDGTTEATLCLLHYDPALDYVLRTVPWRFAMEWRALVRDAKDDSGTAESGAATTLTDSDKSWTVNGYADYYVYLAGGTGADQIRTIASNTATELTVSTAWTTNPDSDTSYEIWENYPPYPWDYQFDLPSDFVRLWDTYPSTVLFERDGSFVRTDEDALSIQYVKTVSTVSSFPPVFLDALVADLAMRLAMPLLRDQPYADRLRQERDELIARARGIERQGQRVKPKSRQWLDARTQGPD